MDPKLVDNLDILIHDIRECKQSMEMLLANLTHDEMMLSENKLDWPTLLNSLRMVSANLISISKFIRDRREQLLKTSIVLPKHFSEDIYPELRDMTDGRICVFNQDVIPNTLRTKLIPPLEEEENKLNQAARDSQQIKAFDKTFKKIIDDAANLVEKPKRDLDPSKQGFNAATYHLQDTLTLVNAMQTNRVRPNVQRMQINEYSKSIQSICKKYPLFTLAMTSAVGMTSGNVLCQSIMYRKTRTFSLMQVAQYASYGFLISGPILRFWWFTLDLKIFKNSAPILKPIKMMIVDQCTTPFVLNAAFLYYLSITNGHSHTESTQNVKDKLMPIVIESYKVWPLATILNFYLIPLNYRVLFSNSIAILWTSYFTYMVSNKK